MAEYSHDRNLYQLHYVSGKKTSKLKEFADKNRNNKIIVNSRNFIGCFKHGQMPQYCWQPIFSIRWS